MEEYTWIIIIAVGMTLLYFVLRYLFNTIWNKGSDAIGNKIRKNRNASTGPVVERLADLYPEIAAKHYQAGTASEMNPVLLRADGASAQGAAAAQGAVENTAFPYTLPGMGTPARVAQPGRIARILGGIVLWIGVAVNVYLLAEAFLFRKALLSDPISTREVYIVVLNRTFLVFGILSLIMYFVLFFAKRTVYTVFYALLSTVIAVTIMITVRWYIFSSLERKNTRLGFSLGRFEKPNAMIILAALIAVVMLVGYLFHFTFGHVWVLWVTLVLSAGMLAAALYAMNEVYNLGETALILIGNFFGYALVLLFYGYAQRKEAKQAIQSAEDLPRGVAR